MYDLHLESYVRQLLPPHRRKERNVAFIRTILKPVETLFNSFSTVRKSAKNYATATGQIAVLEHNCNQIAELPSGYVYITESASCDFAVLVPPFITQLKKQQIFEFISRFKLAGKTFEMVVNE